MYQKCVVPSREQSAAVSYHLKKNKKKNLAKMSFEFLFTRKYVSN